MSSPEAFRGNSSTNISRRALVTSDMIAAELDERLFVDIGIVTHGNKSLDCLAGVRVGYADNSCLIHVRVHCQHSFNLGRVHVEARQSYER